MCYTQQLENDWVYSHHTMTKGYQYSQQGAIKQYNVKDNKNTVNYTALIAGSRSRLYSTEVSINKQENSIQYTYCSCPAFRQSDECKHVAALCFHIDSNPIDVERIQQTLDWSRAFLQNTQEIEESSEKKYQLRINIKRFSQYPSDMTMSLYEQKKGKNGKWTKGKMLKKKEILERHITDIADIAAFSVSSTNHWHGHQDEPETFETSAQAFISIVQNFSGEITDMDGNPLPIHFSIGKCMIDIQKKEDTYQFKGQLFFPDIQGPIPFDTGEYIVSLSKYGGFYNPKYGLFFFISDFSPAFLNTLSQGAIDILPQDITGLKQNSKYIKHIISQSTNPEILPFNIQTSEPKMILTLTIPEDLSSAELASQIIYGDETPLSRTETSPYITLPESEEIFQRNIEKEEALFNQIPVEKLETIAQVIPQSHSLKFHLHNTSEEHTQRFFQVIDDMIQQGIDVQYKQDIKKISNTRISPKVTIDEQQQTDWFDLTISAHIDNTPTEIEKEMMDSIQAGKPYILLENGEAVKIHENWKNIDKEMLSTDIDTKGSLNSSVGKYDIGKLAALEKSMNKKQSKAFSAPKTFKKLANQLIKHKGIPGVQTPKTIQAELRPYQKDGYKWMYFLWEQGLNAILADDMGLGKTLQTITLLSKYKNLKKLKKHSLIICPSSLTWNWYNEIQKFAPHLNAHIIEKSTFTFPNKKEQDVYIVSYGIISNILQNNQNLPNFFAVILDEAQNIKNSKTKRTKSLLTLQSEHKLALSGTPIENHIGELWSLYQFLMPGFLGPEKQFLQKHKTKEELTNLSQKIKPFVLRRTKSEVLKDLPEKTEQTIVLEMESKQKAKYTTLMNAYQKNLLGQIQEEKIDGKTQFEIFEALLRLRQTCLHPDLITKKEIALGSTDISIKLRHLEQTLPDMIENNHRILIFSQFPSFLSHIQALLNKQNFPFLYIDGQTKNRQKLVDEFQDGDIPIFLISLKAGGTGLNLTAADTVIHMDPWWNPAVENQASDRAHRIGQKRSVSVYKYIVKESIEEKILILQEKKKALFEQVLSGSNKGKLSAEDIRFIFE